VGFCKSVSAIRVSDLCAPCLRFFCFFLVAMEALVHAYPDSEDDDDHHRNIKRLKSNPLPAIPALPIPSSTGAPQFLPRSLSSATILPMILTHYFHFFFLGRYVSRRERAAMAANSLAHPAPPPPPPPGTLSQNFFIPGLQL
jgi:hypothetical protein